MREVQHGELHDSRVRIRNLDGERLLVSSSDS